MVLSIKTVAKPWQNRQESVVIRWDLTWFLAENRPKSVVSTLKTVVYSRNYGDGDETLC